MAVGFVDAHARRERIGPIKAAVPDNMSGYSISRRGAHEDAGIKSGGSVVGAVVDVEVDDAVLVDIEAVSLAGCDGDLDGGVNNLGLGGLRQREDAHSCGACG